MDPWILSVLASVLSGVCVAVLVAIARMLRGFIIEQRGVNEANRLANRSMQREVIYRMFREHVEHGEPMAPHELEHLNEVYGAYHANGGNGTATVMFERITEFGKISTEVKEV